eukprot:3679546-Alexandrium_andersonii.AAC.1
MDAFRPPLGHAAGFYVPEMANQDCKISRRRTEPHMLPFRGADSWSTTVAITSAAANFTKMLRIPCVCVGWNGLLEGWID